MGIGDGMKCFVENLREDSWLEMVQSMSFVSVGLNDQVKNFVYKLRNLKKY